MAVLVPDKFVFAHMPKTAGMWIRRHLLDHVPGSMEINPRHMPVSDIKTHQSDLPVVAVCRDPVDWIESMYAYRQDRNEWKPETTVIDQHPHGTLDEWVAALIAEHPGLLTQYADSYLHPADIVFGFETLEFDWSHFLKSQSLPTPDLTARNQSTRRENLSPRLADDWRRSNALYCEQFGYSLPSGPVYALGDWSGHWRSTIKRVLAPRLRGRPVNLLEIGVCEGRGAQAAFEVLLRHPESRYTGIDIWQLNPRHRADRNIALISDDRHTLVDGDRRLVADACGPFDVIYIDGDHTYNGCQSDLIRWSPHVKPGGFLVIDDYGTDTIPSAHPGVKQATDEYLATVSDAVVIHSGYQLTLQKK